MDRFLAVNKAVKRWSIFLRHGRTGKVIVVTIWVCSLLTSIPIANLHEINLENKCRINFLTPEEKCQFYSKKLNEMNKRAKELATAMENWTITDRQLKTIEFIKKDDSRPVQCETDP